MNRMDWRPALKMKTDSRMPEKQRVLKGGIRSKLQVIAEKKVRLGADKQLFRGVKLGLSIDLASSHAFGSACVCYHFLCIVLFVCITGI